MSNTVFKVKLLLHAKMMTLKKLLWKVSAGYVLGIEDKGAFVFFQKSTEQDKKNLHMLGNAQEIAESFTIFEKSTLEKSTLMHATIACMEGLKHALFSFLLESLVPKHPPIF